MVTCQVTFLPIFTGCIHGIMAVLPIVHPDSATGQMVTPFLSGICYRHSHCTVCASFPSGGISSFSI